MNYLVGDIGNTNIKLSILDSNFKIKKIYNLETKEVFKDTMKKKFLNRLIKQKLSKKVLFSSVVPLAFKKIKIFLKKKNYKVFEIKNLKINSIIKTHQGFLAAIFIVEF